MKNPYVKITIHKKQAFSNNKNKTWKKPKWKKKIWSPKDYTRWSGKKYIKGFFAIQNARKKRLKRKALSLLKPKNRWIQPNNPNWRRFMLYWGKIDNSFVEKVKEKMFFWNKWFKDYFMYMEEKTFLKFPYTRKNLLVNWHTLKKNYNLTKRFDLVKYRRIAKPVYKSRYKRNFKFFKKNYSLGIKRILYQLSVRRFRKKYKKTFLKKTI